MLHTETDILDSEELCKITESLCSAEKDPDLYTGTQYADKKDSSFIPMGFVNTAFAGADAIDDVEQASPTRARSPYEVIRGEGDQVPDASFEENTDTCAFDSLSHITKHVEIRRRPLLQHIPSEISEEDLVEREIISPTIKDELEFGDLSNIETSSKVTVIRTSTVASESKSKELPIAAEIETVTSVERKEDEVKDEFSNIALGRTVTMSKEVKYESVSQGATSEEVVSRSQIGEIQISNGSESIAKTGDIGTPDSDTGIPTSPFEETEMTDGEPRSSTALSHTFPKSEKNDKSRDSVITTTHTESLTEKTISVSVASLQDQSDSCTLHEKSELEESKVTCDIMRHSAIVSDTKPLTNGPGEVEYHPEYDYDDESGEKKYELENIVYSEEPDNDVLETDEEQRFRFSSVSDDVIDSEIREILCSDQQLDDIIERPVTPEPPKEDEEDMRFLPRHLKRPSDGAIEGLREDEYAYSGDATLPSPISPESKSGFAYGMHFEKYVLGEGEEAMDIDSDQYGEEKESSFGYGMRFERDPDLEEESPCYGDLYTHQEEDEDALENGDKSKVVQKPSKESEFDVLAGRKYFTKNVEMDELSMSSLQEFERLEAEIVSGRKSSVGSIDSLNGRQVISKSGEHDDVSMSSLTEFEKIEKECIEGEKIESGMQESITQLSEIEEGHESQASETSQENKSDLGKEEDVSIADDYNDQLENIEEIILTTEDKKTEELPFQIVMKKAQKAERVEVGIEMLSKDTDYKISDISVQKTGKTSSAVDIPKVSGWTTSKSLESSSLGDGKDDLDQDSLRDELSLKPDSLIDDTKQDFQDSLREERFDDADSLQEENLDEMRDSLFEEKHIEDDSLHDMDIMPDESSLSLEGSLHAAASLDSSKADEFPKVKIVNGKDNKNIQLSYGSTIETFQIEGKTQVNISDLPKMFDVMQSSTDSLEQNNSALAAFQIESESLMSSSLNSAITSEDCTMVSSTDTVEHEGRITFKYEDIPVDEIEMLVRSGHRVIVDSEGNFQAHYGGKQHMETEEITNAALGLSKDVTEANLPPTTIVQVHSALTNVKYVNGGQEQEKTFHHTSADEDYKSFESSHFDPDVEVEEIETTDEFGNTKIIRKIKKVTNTKAQFSSSSSPKDVEEKMKEFLREHTAGVSTGTAEEEIEEQKTTDEKGNVVVIRTVKQQIVTDPEVHSRTFTGPTAEEQSEQFVHTFQTLDPTEDVKEYEKVDEQGNVVRVTQKFVVMPKVHTLSFTGPDAHKQMEEYMKQWTLQSQNLGEFEGDQQRTMLPTLQMSRSTEHSEASIPSGICMNFFILSTFFLT